jgi:hypothetical protein
VAEALAAEEPRDFTVSVGKLRLDERDGRLRAAGSDPGTPGLGYSDHAFRQLVQQVPGLRASEAPRGMVGALLHLTDQERARIVNARVERSEADVTLRTKVAHNGPRFARAALSERYADCDDHAVAEAIGGCLSSRSATVKLNYRPGESVSAFEMIFPSEIPVHDFRVGDVHMAMIQVRNSEIGSSSLEVVPAVIRARCSNLTLSTGKGVITRMIHLGDSQNLKNKLKAALLAAELQIAPLIAAIQKSAQTPLEVEPGDIIAQLARALSVPVARAKDWRDTLEARYLTEGPLTVWSLSSAITEAAQHADNWLLQEREEKIGSRIIAENGLGWVNNLGKNAEIM